MSKFSTTPITKEQLEQINVENDELFTKIGMTRNERFFCAGRPVVIFKDITSDSDEIDLDIFTGRIAIKNGGILSTGINPFPCGPARLTIVKWGDDEDQCGYIDCSSTLNGGPAIISLKRVTIGKNVLFGPDVTITDSDEPIDEKLSPEEMAEKIAPVTIEDHAWLGLGATVLKGVTIGHHAVVSANAVVYRDVPPYATAFGNPAWIVPGNPSGEK
ncbi:MAG TPA: acyltransferase [Phycisphaerae bacterium]|nr:acyltransferase [Phycisphaerae bacterium]